MDCIRMAASWLLALGTGTAAGAESRFSGTFGAAERPAMGIERLSSDQLAILDALVRREAEVARHESEPSAGVPRTFSQRLTDAERKNAGLNHLSPEELQRLDAAVARFQLSDRAQHLLTPPIFVSHRSAARTVERRREADVTGSVTLSYGWGGGYSTKSGSMIVNVSDPSRRYSVTIGYGETQISGPPGPMIHPTPLSGPSAGSNSVLRP